MSFALFPFQAEAEWLIILDDPKRTMPTFVSFKNQWDVFNNLISVKAAKVLSIYEGKVVCWLCKRL
jgi:hypothetical protein